VAGVSAWLFDCAAAGVAGAAAAGVAERTAGAVLDGASVEGTAGCVTRRSAAFAAGSVAGGLAWDGAGLGCAAVDAIGVRAAVRPAPVVGGFG
jgi:hypothetical protein